MKGHLFRNDKLGLTKIWFAVPNTKELPTFFGLTAKERRARMGRHLDIQQQKSQYEQRSRSGWPHRRRGEEAKSDQEAAES